MEEVKCALLGLGAALVQLPLTGLAAAPATTGAAAPAAAADVHRDATAVSPLESLTDAALPFHPTEQLLLQRALPLGQHYHVLQRATRAAAVGRADGSGLYPAAIASGVQKVLAHYAAAVKAAASPAALAALPATYALAFALLEGVVARQREPERCLPLLSAFLHHQEVPAAFRRSLGESVWLAVLFTTAHYVAHGVVLHARPDYFIAVRAKTAETSTPTPPPSASTASRPATSATTAAAEEHVLFTDRLPPGVSAELGLLILAAGKERRVLLRDTDVQGGSDYLEQLALGSQDEAANAVFHSVFNAQLCHGGVLAVAELTARVEAAKTLWSRALWMKVGDVPSLRVHLAALRSMFLCHRGDVWFAFVERVLPVLAGVQPVSLSRRGSAAAGAAEAPGLSAPLPGLSHAAAGDADRANEEEREDAAVALARAARVATSRGALLQRTAADAFLFALSVSSLRDVAAYETFTMRVAGNAVQQADAAFAATDPARAGRRSRSGSTAAAAASTEDVARHLLAVVQALYLQYIPPQGLLLIVSPKAMQYYQRLFSFHLALRVALEALAATRTLFAEALVTNANPSIDLRRALALFHLLHFISSSLGYYMQVDVISVYTARLEGQLASPACASVDQAKRLHDQFIWHVSEATFLTDGAEPLLRACQSLNTCAVTLYVLCTRYRIPYWAVDGVNETPVEVRATLAALEARVQQDVVAVFTGHLGLGARSWERALWSRLDFNGYFSQHRTRPMLPVLLRSVSTAATGATAPASGASPAPRPTRARAGAGTPSRASGRTATPRREQVPSRRTSAG